MLGTVEANEILLQASKLPQQCFDIHLTPREENAKGKRSSTSMAQTANQAEGGREARKEEKLRMESRNQKQTLCFAVWFVMGPWLHQIPFLPFCVIFLPSFPPPVKCMLLFCPSSGRRWDSCTVGSL